jgi:flagellar hook-associated protein FlgK
MTGGLTLALNNALSGLNVNQRAMAVLSNNIANANTEGYSRQTLDLSSVTYDGVGQGVRVEDVVRKVDEFLLTAINRQQSKVAEADTVNDYMERLQIALGDPSAQNSIDAQIETFFNSVQSMAETPERTSTRAAVVNSGVNLAREISNLAENIETLRMQADADIELGITTVNSTLRQLYTLNESLAHADAFGTSKATLLDQRDTALTTLASFMDIRTYETENSAVHIYVGEGLSLLDESLHELSYEKLSSLQGFVENSKFNSVQIHSLNIKGERIGQPVELISGGTSAEVTAHLSSGKLAGLLELRDTTFPNMLEQVDMLANIMRDSFNEVHNQGTGYPPAKELTGTRPVAASDRIAWEGAVRIAALDNRGQPARSGYANQTTGVQPLTLNLDTIFNGVSYGEPTTQDVIKEINSYFGAPKNRVELGNLNQIQLALSSESIPTSSSNISFDFDLQNISGEYADFWVGSVQVLDNMGVDITSYTDTMPLLDLNPANTFATTLGSDLVTISTQGSHNLKVGDRIKLNDPGLAIDGIPGAQFDNYFVIQSVTGTSFTVQLPSNAVAGGSTSVAMQTASPAYGTVGAGIQTRLQQNGSITTSLAGNPASNYYDINVTMTVRDEAGNLSNAVVTYRINNPATNTRNDRIPATAVAGAATLVIPQTSQAYLRAIMVDEDGVELPPMSGGGYGDQTGFLKIISDHDDFTIAVDERNSGHLGLPSDTPPKEASGRGFSYFYELNNFFQSNQPVDTGDTLKNSAYYLAVEDRFSRTPSLLATGNLQLSNQPVAGTGLDPIYTYERYSGDNSIAQALAKIGISPTAFGAAGGLTDSNLTLNGYAGEMLGFMTTQTIGASATLSNQQILLDGYRDRATAISGVSLDEELGNTILYQNAYSASAKVISTTDELFQTLLQAF